MHYISKYYTKSSSVKKNTTPTVPIQDALIYLFQILQEADGKVKCAKYEGTLEQKEEDIIQKMSEFPSMIVALKQYAFRLKPTTIDGGMTWTNIKSIQDAPIKEILKDTKEYLKVQYFGVYIQLV